MVEFKKKELLRNVWRHFKRSDGLMNKQFYAWNVKLKDCIYPTHTTIAEYTKFFNWFHGFLSIRYFYLLLISWVGCLGNS